MTQAAALPIARSGQRIGLFGGSFDPAHGGHVHITLEALKRFDLDAIWWLVSPGNPLKLRGPAPLVQRLAHARRIMRHPRVHVTDLESHLGTQYTAKTLAALQMRSAGARFVWLMGADNMAQLHLWQDWQWIMENVPVGILARPGDRISARLSLAAKRYQKYRISGTAARSLGLADAPAWCFVNVPMVSQSSTEIRNAGHWVQHPAKL